MWSRFHIGSNIGVGEAGVEDVLHRLLAQVVVDAEDVLLREQLASRRLSARAVARLWPNGFSITSRASSAQPESRERSATVANRLGGTAR